MSAREDFQNLYSGGNYGDNLTMIQRFKNLAGKVYDALFDPTYPTVTTVTDNLALDDTYTGNILRVTADAKTITLPATAAGLRYVIVNAGADGTQVVTISPAADDKIMGAFCNKGTNIVMSGTDNKDLVNTKTTAKKGDRITLVADGVDGWYIENGVGVWTEESQVAKNANPKTVETLTGAKTVTIADTGKVFILSAAAGAEITLPAVASSAGFNARIVTGLAFANTAWTIKAASNVVQGGAIVNSTFVGSANQNLVTFAHAAETVGDYIDINCDGTNWYATGVAAAAGGITFTAP